MPDFTIIVPAYNAAAFIGETLEALRRQTDPPRRVIIIDDGSIDDTGEVVRRDFPEMTLLQVENGGCPLARQKGIVRSDTEWIALCDSDDVWNPDCLQRKQELIQTFPDAQLLFSNFYSFGPNAIKNHHQFLNVPDGWFDRYQGETRGDFFRLSDPYRAILEYNPAFASSLAFRRDAYERMGGFLEKYARQKCEDSEFVRRFVALPDIVVAGDREPTYGYRRHDSNISKVRWERFYCKPQILREHLRLGVVPEPYRDEVKREIERNLLHAFDIAYWDRSWQGVHRIFNELPPSARTLRRRVQLWHCRLRAARGSPRAST